MLTQEQLLALLADLESDRIERTASTSKTDKFGEAICAFANDLTGRGQPGYLLIGVHDNGALSGLTVTDDLLKNLAAIRSDGNVLPQPAMTVARFVLDGGEVAVVEVLPSDLPPVRYKGRTWVRVARLNRVKPCGQPMNIRTRSTARFVPAHGPAHRQKWDR